MSALRTRTRVVFASVVAVLVALPPAGRLFAAPREAGWDEVDRILGRPGTDAPGAVRRYGFPRSDLQVRIGDVAVEPPLALGSWAAFRPLEGEAGGAALVMGDLALLGPEVNPVARELEARGLEVLAIHNHLLEESPRVVYLHFHGHAGAAALATALDAALRKTATPRTPPAGSPPALTPGEEKLLHRFEDALGRKGTMAGRVLQFGVPRAEAIREGGVEIPPSMGMANAINVQAAGERVATTGDFVLVADEVNPVIQALHAHGLDVTALHSHMLRENPRLFFLHFWGVGDPNAVGAGVRDALAKIATK